MHSSLFASSLVFVQHPVLIGLWFGLLHALDADHLTTLGSLSVSNRRRSPIGYAAHWALGHAVALTLFGIVVLGLGVWGFAVLSDYAEALVGIALVVLGVHAFGAAFRQTQMQAPATAPLRKGRTGIWMGLLHGGAGSAAVLALVPLAYYESGAGWLVYIASFSAGVAVSALLFSALFQRLYERVRDRRGRAVSVFVAVVALAAIAAGLLLLIGLINGRG